MKYLSTAYTYLTIFGRNLDMDSLRHVVDIAPTDICENRLKEKSYEYKVEANDALDGLDMALDKLREKFLRLANPIKLYAAQNGLSVKVFIVLNRVNNEETGIILKKDFVLFLAEIGAEIEIDTYNC